MLLESTKMPQASGCLLHFMLRQEYASKSKNEEYKSKATQQILVFP